MGQAMEYSHEQDRQSHCFHGTLGFGGGSFKMRAESRQGQAMWSFGGQAIEFTFYSVL